MLARVWLVWRTLLAHYRQHPAQGIFLLAGLSLAVALLLGTLMVGQAADNAFAKAQQTVGRAIVGHIFPAEGHRTIPQSLYAKLRTSGYTDLLPQVQGRIRLEDDRFLSLSGLDLFALMHRTSKTTGTSSNQNFGSLSLLAFSYPPYQTWAPRTLAKIHHLSDGSVLRLKDGQSLPPIKTIDDDIAAGYQLLCDLHCAQSILSLDDRLTSIALTAMPKDVARLRQLLPPQAELRFSAKDLQNQAMSDAFLLNITAVSLLAFLVGCFIAFNAVRFSVLQRTVIVQRLRLTGVTVGEIAWALILELTLWAILAAIVGSLLGLSLAGALLPRIGMTMAQLFQGKNLLALPEFQQWGLYALAISISAVALAVARPFWQLARQQPLQSSDSNEQMPGITLAGIVLLISGSLLTTLPEQSQWSGYAVTFCWFVGSALLVPALTGALYRFFARQPWLQRYPKIHWVLADGARNQARLSVAMMAFTVAIAAAIAVNTMVSSFQQVFEAYLDKTLAEDLYINVGQSSKADKVFDYLNSRNDVAMAYRYYHIDTTISVSDKPLEGFIRAINDTPLRHQSVGLESQVEDMWAKLHQRQGVVINQALALLMHLSIGDAIDLKTPVGKVKTQVLGVYDSYGATTASVIIDEQWMTDLWPGLKTAQVGVFLVPGEPDNKVIEALIQHFDINEEQLLKPQTIRAMALKVFRQTFAATDILGLFILLVAAIGIYCACYIAQLSQKRSIALLKVLGIAKASLLRLSLFQLLLSSTIAALIAIPLGLAVAWASVHILLRYSFGWQFAVTADITTVSSIVLTALAVAVCAGLHPFYRMSKTNDIEAMAPIS